MIPPPVSSSLGLPIFLVHLCALAELVVDL